ncbi:MAG: DUF2393 domain-containing protein [Campylobacter sp.]|nr:DUF2393 domain-containing protein [Campylobacter sp.]
MISSIKQNIFFVLANAHFIDYLIYGWIFIAFVFIVFLGIFFALKSWWQIGFLFIITGLFALFAAIFYANGAIAQNLRPVGISEINKRQLTYSNALMIDFNITNDSKNILNVCRIDLGFYVVSKQKSRDFLNSLNPFARKTITLREPFIPGETKQIREFVNNFAFIDYNITKKAECF